MKDLELAFKKTHTLLAPLAGKHAIEMVAIFLFCEMFDQYFKYMGLIVGSSTGPTMVITVGRMTVSLLQLVLFTHWVPLRVSQFEGQLPTENLFAFITRHIRDFTLESLRAMGMTFLFLLLLVIPGLVKYVEYSFVSFIVLTDPEYKAGKIDALKESQRLMTGYRVIGLVALIAAIPASMYFGQLSEATLMTVTPFKWLLSFLMSSAITYYLSLLLFEFYRVRKTALSVIPRSADGADVRLETDP